MISTVKSRPNNYEVLGLTRGATAAEIAQAFAKAVGMFRTRPMAELADLSVAYETLRDPARRRDYDATLSPPPMPKLGYSARLTAIPLPRLADDPFLAPKQQPISEPRPEAPAPPIVAESPPQPLEQRQPESQPRLDPDPEARLEYVLENIRAAGRAERERLQAERSPIEWNRTGIALGGLALGIVLVGAWAGAHARDADEPQLDKAGLTVALPAARPHPTPGSAAPAPRGLEAESRGAGLDWAAAKPIAPARSTRHAQVAEDRLGEISQSLEGEPAGAPSVEDAAAEAPAAMVTPASLPLPNAVVAQTISRLGYACGQVASTSAVDGDAPGVFKVTCTSGQTFRAAPVRGRYHFRRWSAR